MNKLLIAAILCTASAAHARAFFCEDDMKFRQDKKEHFGVSVVMGGAAAVYYDDPLKGAIASSAVGVAKEVFDFAVGTCFSKQDAAYDIAGSILGSYTVFGIKGLLIKPQHGGVALMYKTEIQ